MLVRLHIWHLSHFRIMFIIRRRKFGRLELFFFSVWLAKLLMREGIWAKFIMKFKCLECLTLFMWAILREILLIGVLTKIQRIGLIPLNYLRPISITEIDRYQKFLLSNKTHKEQVWQKITLHKILSNKNYHQSSLKLKKCH